MICVENNTTLSQLIELKQFKIIFMGNDHEVEFHEIEIKLFHEIKFDQ
jgi:hypothetical protein